MNKLFKKLLSLFLQGTLFIIPIATTIYILYKLFLWIDGPVYYLIQDHFHLSIPGLGILTVLAIVTLAGFVGSFFLANPIWSFVERLIEKAPLVKVIYTGLKDLIAAFVGDKQRFNKPVLVMMRKEDNIQQVGFITQEDLSDLGIGSDKVAVYMPFSYSVAGTVVICPRENITPIDASGTDMMKFVLSGGVTEVQDGEKEKGKEKEKEKEKE